MPEAKYRAWAQPARVDALNHALAGIPRERSRYHLLGRWNGPHAFDVPLRASIRCCR